MAVSRAMAGAVPDFARFNRKLVADSVETVVCGCVSGVPVMGQRVVFESADKAVATGAVPGLPVFMELHRCVSIRQSAGNAISGVCTRGSGGLGDRLVFLSVSPGTNIPRCGIAGRRVRLVGNLCRGLPVLSILGPDDQFRLLHFSHPPAFYCRQHDHPRAGRSTAYQ